MQWPIKRDLLVTMYDSIECDAIAPTVTEVVNINALVTVNVHNFISYTR